MPSFSGTVEDPLSSGLRLDRYIAEQLKLLSRSQIKARKLKALLNGKPVKISRILKSGDHLELSWLDPESPLLIPENIPLDVIYEDKRVIVVNKPQGMVVHPGAGNRQGTLANALLYLRLRKSGDSSVSQSLSNQIPTSCGLSGHRLGIIHRLDKDTSGVIIAAWDEGAHVFLSEQFKARKVRKSYAAIVQGCPKEKEGCIKKRIVRSRRDRKTFTVSEKEGRWSQTNYKVIRSYGYYSLLLLRPITGRTHQIRVHLRYMGCPILGDPIYSRIDSKFPNATLMLHAKSLSLVLPDDTLVLPGNYHTEPLKKTFRTQLPERFISVIRNLKG